MKKLLVFLVAFGILIGSNCSPASASDPSGPDPLAITSIEDTP